MQKIIDEINKKIEQAQKIIVKLPNDKLDEIANNTAEDFIEAYKGCIELVEQNKKGDWIPVSERLPDAPPEGTADEDCPEYLVMIKDFSVPTTLYYSSDGSWFDDNGYVYKVIAWMPLPEPYKEV